MQRLLLGQDTPVRWLEPTTLVTVQAAAPPVGLREVTTLPLGVPTLPLLSTATQRTLLGQDTLTRELVPSTLVTVQAAAPPMGLLEVTTLPPLSTATQRPLLGQDTPYRPLELSTLVTVHVNGEPPASATGLTSVDPTAKRTAQNTTHRRFTGSSPWPSLLTTATLARLAAVCAVKAGLKGPTFRRSGESYSRPTRVALAGL